MPLIEIVFAEYEAVTPAGNPTDETTAVTPIVACVKTPRVVLTHILGELEATPTVLSAVTVIVASAEFELEQTPDLTTALYLVVDVKFKYS